jgi:hypothetical protein
MNERDIFPVDIDVRLRMDVRHGLQKNDKSRQGCNERLPRKKKMNERKHASKQAAGMMMMSLEGVPGY